MFSRKKQADNSDGVACPFCEVVNPLGSETCSQCYYSLNISAREQPMAEPSTSGDEIMSLLLAENDEKEEEGVVVEAVLTLDEISVEIDQYEVTDPVMNAEGEAEPEGFQFFAASGPTLSSTVESQPEEEVELRPEDAPANPVEFELETIDPLAQVAEPVHTGRGGLYSPSVPTVSDDDLLGSVGPITDQDEFAIPDLPDDIPDMTAAAPAVAVASTPALPELPGDTPQPDVAPVATPDLPDFGETELPVLPEEGAPAQPNMHSEPAPPEAASTPTSNRIWPWPASEPWSDMQVYQEVVSAMEHVKHGRMNEAAETIDALGPHLDENLDMLLHVSVLMQHLGRQEHVTWTLDMAAHVYPQNPQVEQARAQILG
ncbi:MAG: hypothetical protein L7S56_04015 [Candidatus Poseidonia sp.]|nr:hypothetical protein [Poseidonia sp.]